MSFCVLVVLCAVLNSAISAKTLTTKPDWLNTCRKVEPDFDECSTKSTQVLFNVLGGGMPAIGLKPLDPLKIKRIHISQGDGPVNLDVSMENVTVTGLKDVKVVANRVDPKSYHFFTKTTLPKLRIEGVYKASGRILVVPLKGQGDCWLEPSDLILDTETDTNLITKGNFKFYNVTGVHINFTFGKMKLNLNNLFEGNKELSEGTNKYLNENWRAASEALRPVLSKTIEDILYAILKQVFDHIPADFFVSDID